MIAEGAIDGQLQRYGFDSSIIDPENITSAIAGFYSFMSEKFRPLKWYRELPLETEIEGRLYKGEADLLLDTEAGYVLIDYKSYPGSKGELLDPGSGHYAGKYAGQLNTYRNMIEDITGKKVIKTLIYYPVSGVIVELKS